MSSFVEGGSPAARPISTFPTSTLIEAVVRAAPRDVGGISVRRALPTLLRRRVGPFVFIDHLGPVDLVPGEGLDVGPHPHIGLATVTYLFEGAITHRDSLGCTRDITPGAVNWMTAGRGITHSERTPAAARASGQRLHGVQAWVGLPLADERAEPSFVHHAAETLPTYTREGVVARILVGEAFGLVSPVRCASPTLYLDVALEDGASFTLGEASLERAIYLARGAVLLDGEAYFEGEMVILRPGVAVPMEATCSTRLIVLGGAPLEGDRHLLWNFVGSDKASLDAAKDDWEAGRFPPVVDDDGPKLSFP